MTDYENFPVPPITEAIIDIRIERDNLLSLETLGSLEKDNLIANKFPEKNSYRSIAIEGTIGATGKDLDSSVKEDVLGYLFRSSDQKKIVQFRLDGFTFNRLSPYKSWEEMTSEAEPLWKIYSGVLNNRSIRRLAVRYINTIEIPETKFELDDYFNFISSVNIDKSFAADLIHFYTKATIKLQSSQAFAHIVQTVTAPQKPCTTNVILDIETFLDNNGKLKDKDIWNLLQHLREMKNQVFFGYIKEKTKILFRN